MRVLFKPLCSISIFFLLAVLVFVPGCGPRRYGTKALFTRPELISRGRLAVIGLTPEQEQVLMACYTKTFTGQIVTFVERNRLEDILGEQDLPEGRLDDNKRAKIQRILGVEALIMCTYYDADTGGTGKKLRIRIVDSETGAIIGSVITLAPDNFQSHASMAVRALRNDVMGKNQLEPA
ncbi:MAG: hypothetical protein JSW59_00290, partial [Phycisphaerales bacterium]